MLWQSMHPEPLSLEDNSLKIPAEIIENCDLNARNRLIESQEHNPDITPWEIHSDPTMLEALIPIERTLLRPD